MKSKSILLLFLAITGLAAILTRTVSLDERAPHHDESIHALYSFYEYHDSNLSYKYDPMLHGPLLYKVLPYIYHAFSPTIETARAFNATLYCLSLLLVSYLLFKRAGLMAGTFFLLAIGLSPQNILWSRFIRHDSLVLFFLSLTVCTFLAPIKERWKLPLALALLVLQFTAKENAYMTLGLLIFYALFFLLSNFIRGYGAKIKENLSRYCSPAALGLCLFTALFIYAALYSNGFTYLEGIRAGIYEKSLLYWFHQHKIERIAGPFFYNFMILSWYDFFFLLSTLFFYLLPKRSRWKLHLSLLAGTLVLAMIAAISINWVEAPTFIDHILKLKHPFDVYIFLIMLVMGALTTFDHLERREFLFAFLGFFFWANWFSYSYVGEKVPWLALYPLFFGTIYHCALLTDWKVKYFCFRHRNALSLGCCLLLTFQCYQIYRSCFLLEGSKFEITSQVHTTKDFDLALSELRQKLRQNSKEEIKTRALLVGEPIWPGTWYLFSLPGYTFRDPGKGYENYDFIIADQKWMSWNLEIERTHRVSRLPFRHWWQPDWSQLGFINWARYLILRTPWNEPATLGAFKLELIRP